MSILNLTNILKFIFQSYFLQFKYIHTEYPFYFDSSLSIYMASALLYTISVEN